MCNASAMVSTLEQAVAMVKCLPIKYQIPVKFRLDGLIKSLKNCPDEQPIATQIDATPKKDADAIPCPKCSRAKRQDGQK